MDTLGTRILAKLVNSNHVLDFDEVKFNKDRFVKCIHAEKQVKSLSSQEHHDYYLSARASSYGYFLPQLIYEFQR